MIDASLQTRVERFLYEEARLLDEGRLHEWLDLFADDIHYWMPTREMVQGVAHQTEVPQPGVSFGLMDENKLALQMRVARLDTGMAHIETPASITRRLVSNVLVEEPNGEGELLVRCNFMVFQLRHGRHDSVFVGRREDHLRPVDGTFTIAKRMVMLDQPLLPRTISIFF